MRCAAEPLCHMCLSWDHQCRQDSPLEEPPSRDTPSVAGGYDEFDSEAVNQAHAAGLPFAQGSVSASSSAAGPPPPPLGIDHILAEFDVMSTRLGELTSMLREELIRQQQDGPAQRQGDTRKGRRG